MPSKNPRLHVTLSESDMEIIHILALKKNTSASAIGKILIERGLEDYEDMLLSKRAEDAEKRWIKSGRKTISHEDLCRELGI